MMVAMDSFSPPVSMQECGVHVHICMLDVGRVFLSLCAYARESLRLMLGISSSA